MLRIDCPDCGTRDEIEFRYGGETHLSRPEPETDDAQWSDYLFNRKNPKGVLFERWCHSFGCGQWFNVARHTVTHEILQTYTMCEPKPEIKQ